MSPTPASLSLSPRPLLGFASLLSLQLSTGCFYSCALASIHPFTPSIPNPSPELPLLRTRNTLLCQLCSGSSPLLLQPGYPVSPFSWPGLLQLSAFQRIALASGVLTFSILLALSHWQLSYFSSPSSFPGSHGAEHQEEASRPVPG